MSDIPCQLEVCQSCGTPIGSNPIALAGPWLVDASRGTVAYNGQPVYLTPAQSKIMHLLVSRPGTVFTKEMLLNATGTDALQKIVDVWICKIRRSLKDAFGEDAAKQIQTVWGRGYTLDLSAQPHQPTPLAPFNRWPQSLKLSVLYSIERGEFTDEQFCEENGVQQHELDEWRRLNALGTLKVTGLDHIRQQARKNSS